MTPARFQTIEEIFLAALEQQPDQVSAFLDAACEGDAVLRREVEALLASDQRAGRFIETSSVGLATKVIQNQQADSLVGRTIGHYKISESIGTGGMGEVYLATDITAGRKAALKLLPLRFTGDAERLKRDFVGNVSYELRTPLTTIIGYSELLESLGEALPDRSRSYVTAVRAAASPRPMSRTPRRMATRCLSSRACSTPICQRPRPPCTSR